jgi:hypothetical protein
MRIPGSEIRAKTLMMFEIVPNRVMQNPVNEQESGLS